MPFKGLRKHQLHGVGDEAGHHSHNVRPYNKILLGCTDDLNFGSPSVSFTILLLFNQLTNTTVSNEFVLYAGRFGSDSWANSKNKILTSGATPDKHSAGRKQDLLPLMVAKIQRQHGAEIHRG